MTVLTFEELYQQLERDQKGYFRRLALNPLAQFGSEEQPLLGARYLPEVLVPENAYTEEQIRYRTQPALDGTRYSPAQMQRGGMLLGSLKVELGHTDTADEFTGQQHDGLVKLLMRGGDLQAIAQVIRWADSSLLRPHIIKNELQRWDAIIRAQTVRRGSDGYEETVNYYAPPGHRPTVGGGTVGTPAGWYAATGYDPFDDIFAGVQKLEDLGYELTDIIMSGRLLSVIKQNSEVVKRTSKVIVNAGGQIQGSTGRVSTSDVQAIASDEGLPEFTVYNAGYETATGFRRYLDAPNNDRDYVVMLGRSRLQWDMKTDYASRVEGVTGTYDPSALDVEDLTINNTLGYFGVGRNVGQGSSGRTIYTEFQGKKPVGLYGEAYQTGLPVIQEPQAIYVIQVMRPTA
jgi:hypothetical protein